MGLSCMTPEIVLLSFSGQNISEELTRLVSFGGIKKQMVGQADLIPSHAAQQVWKDRFHQRRVVLYIDIIKGTSPTKDSVWFINE